MSETKPDNLPKFDFSKLSKDYTRFDFWKDYVYCVRPNRQSQDEIIVVNTTDSTDLQGALVDLGDLAKHFGIPKSLLVGELNCGQRWPSFGGFDVRADYTQCITPIISAAGIASAADLTDVVAGLASPAAPSYILTRLGSKLSWCSCTTNNADAPTVPSDDELRAMATVEIAGWRLDEDALENNPTIANIVRVYRPGEKIEQHLFHVGWVPLCWGVNTNDLMTSSALTASTIRTLFACNTYLREEDIAPAIADLQKPFGKVRVGRYARSTIGGGHVNQVCCWLARLHADPNVAIDPSGEYLDFFNADNGKTIRLVFKDEFPKILKKADFRRFSKTVEVEND